MGVISQISLNEVNNLFASYNFTKLTPTQNGVIDTTYIVETKNASFILKKYERDIPKKIADDIALLKKLSDAGLNVPLYLGENGGWHLYTKLQGVHPKSVKSYHIQAVARFLAKLHSELSCYKCTQKESINEEILEALNYAKKEHFSYFKKFEFLKEFNPKQEFLIHGDIFKDNTLFDGKKIGVIDFIDSQCLTFVFDAAVTLIGFDVREKDNYLINLFLKNYNQHAPKKCNRDELLYNMKRAAHFYALKRVFKYKSTTRAKELLS